jgi:hypothetical protein
MMYYVKRTEPQLWTVGHDVANGKWNPVKDFDSKEGADLFVLELNGANNKSQLEWYAHQYTKLNDDIRKLIAANEAMAERIGHLESMVIEQ